jgi:hypothetical protein
MKRRLRGRGRRGLRWEVEEAGNRRAEGKGRLPRDVDFVREIGENFGVAAELQIERLFDGNGTAAVAALIPAARRVGWRFHEIEPATEMRQEISSYTQLKPP